MDATSRENNSAGDGVTGDVAVVTDNSNNQNIKQGDNVIVHLGNQSSDPNLTPAYTQGNPLQRFAQVHALKESYNPTKENYDERTSLYLPWRKIHQKSEVKKRGAYAPRIILTLQLL